MSKTPVYIANHRSGDFSATRTTGDTPDVTAAGCLIWRTTHDKLEVLIIHRPKYDDWSWPKGKQDAAETLPETAIREVEEEVNLRVTLGVPLAVTSYRVKHGSKDVYYWAAQLPAGATAEADHGEVDRLNWVSIKEARKLLTNKSDLLPLDRLEKLWKEGNLATRSLVVVRHAKAKPRSNWSAAEGERPLAATGKRQALAVCRLLAAWGPEKIYSSPWVRCMQTVAHYNKKTGTPIKEKSALTEAAHKRHPKKAAKVIASLFDKDYSVALCTHRPVLPTVLDVFSDYSNKHLTAKFPKHDPYLAPGEMLVLHLSRRHRKRIISLEQIRPFDD